jgi:V-type H+-transporting ATPase subunit E
MQNFILQEAEDKASEIKAKAQEEFSIEKARIVMAEKMKIMKEYERKEKQIEVQKKIAASNELNQARLKVLKSRDDVIQKLLVDAQKRLGVSGDPSSEQYKTLVKDLIVQGLLRLNEPRVQVVGRKGDLDLLKSVLETAKQEYSSLGGQKVDLTIDEKNFLPPGPSDGYKGPICSGGIILSALDGKIICKNTLDARLGLAFEQRLPEVRVKLFGKSLTRVHFD